jgi:hypothetical protein
VHRIELTGLWADLPIGAMAAFGCLRICDRTPQWRGSNLSWSQSGGGFQATLWTYEERKADELVAALIADVAGAGDRLELSWAEQIKTAAPGMFVRNAERALAEGASQRDTSDWFAAFGSDLGNDDKIEPTPFDMSVARQKFLADARRLALTLADRRNVDSGKTAGAYQEALFGPWTYRDDQHSLGWDPSTMKLGAFTYKAPTAMVNTGVRAAVWLAFESLPLFPCFYDHGLKTRAFRAGREVSFCWPVWTPPISLDALRTLLGWAALLEDEPPIEELRARGVAAVFRSTKFKPNKYLANFRTPELVASTGV